MPCPALPCPARRAVAAGGASPVMCQPRQPAWVGLMLVATVTIRSVPWSIAQASRPTGTSSVCLVGCAVRPCSDHHPIHLLRFHATFRTCHIDMAKVSSALCCPSPSVPRPLLAQVRHCRGALPSSVASPVNGIPSPRHPVMSGLGTDTNSQSTKTFHLISRECDGSPRFTEEHRSGWGRVGMEGWWSGKSE